MISKISSKWWARPVILWQVRRLRAIHRSKHVCQVWALPPIAPSTQRQRTQMENNIRCKLILCNRRHQIQWPPIWQRATRNLVAVQRLWQHHHHQQHHIGRRMDWTICMYIHQNGTTIIKWLINQMRGKIKHIKSIPCSHSQIIFHLHIISIIFIEISRLFQIAVAHECLRYAIGMSRTNPCRALSGDMLSFSRKECTLGT